MKELNVVGMIAMIVSLIGIFTWCLPCGIIGTILGIVGCSRGEEYGKGMAATGIIIGIFDIIAFLTLFNAILAFL